MVRAQNPDVTPGKFVLQRNSVKQRKGIPGSRFRTSFRENATDTVELIQ